MAVEEGGTAALRCELSKPVPFVEWRRRGSEVLTHGEKYHLRQRDVLMELRIFDVTPEDSDIYTCICGDIESTATLTVNSEGFYYLYSNLHKGQGVQTETTLGF